MPVSKPTADQLQRKRDEYEERAAIKEFDGKLTREQAEAEAFQEVYGEKK